MTYGSQEKREKVPTGFPREFPRIILGTSPTSEKQFLERNPDGISEEFSEEFPRIILGTSPTSEKQFLERNPDGISGIRDGDANRVCRVANGRIRMAEGEDRLR